VTVYQDFEPQLSGQAAFEMVAAVPSNPVRVTVKGSL